jgi:hypothetical protein
MAGSWEWEHLIQTLRDTLDLVKLRAVEPEHLQDDLYGQLLPGLLYETVRDPVGSATGTGRRRCGRPEGRVECRPTHDGFSHWARIEPRPRGHDFDRTLQARVEDPLWMLTRQWQFGEFHGEDAGSAVMTTLAHRSSPITQIRVGASSAPYDHAVPLEARVERLPIDFPPPLSRALSAGTC